jgi:purine-binding chemotaxis protein CheW
MKLSEQSTQSKGLSGVRVLVFQLGSEEYAINVSRIREVIGHVQTTRLPSVPNDVLGVINLRGQVITVVDARLRMKLPKMAPTNETVVTILDLNGCQVGLQVDAVHGVFTFSSDEVSSPPESDSRVMAGAVRSVIRRQKRMILELNPDVVLGHLKLPNNLANDLNDNSGIHSRNNSSAA